MIFEVAPQPKQKEALVACDNYQYVLYGGARGGGKSHLMRIREVKRRLLYPKTRGLIIRRTYNELWSNHIQPILQEYPGLSKYYIDGKKTIFWPNGSITRFGYLRNEKDLLGYQGIETDDLGVDEATQHEEVIITKLIASVRPKPGYKSSILFTANPGGVGHEYFKRLFINRQFKGKEDPNEYIFIPARVYDNEAIDQKQYIANLGNLSETTKKQWLDGDWNAYAGQAFIVSEAVVGTPQPHQPVTYWGGFDWGYNHPYAFVLFAIGIDGRLSVLSTSTGRQKDPFSVGKLIRELLTAKGIVQIPLFAGLDIFKSDGRVPIYKELASGLGASAYLLEATVNRTQGAQAIRDVLAGDTPRLLVDYKCDDLISCIKNMQVDPKNTEDVLKVNADEHGIGGDDLYDAFRYGVIGERQIAQVAPKPVEIDTGEYLMKKVAEQGKAELSVDPWDY